MLLGLSLSLSRVCGTFTLMQPELSIHDVFPLLFSNNLQIEDLVENSKLSTKLYDLSCELTQGADLISCRGSVSL